MNTAPGRRFRRASPGKASPDLLLVAGLLVAALAVRLPYLQLVPLVTDEAFEVLAALPILRGEWLLYGPVNPTAGPLLTYLLALGFWLAGPGMYVPRAVILVVGVLTVGATYFLGRSMAGRLAGLAAGALMAFTPVHILVNSHIAWSNSASPLFAALTFVLLHAAVRRRDGWLLVAGGFCYGLALQTHVSLLVAAPGLLVWFLARRGVATWLRSPWPYLAAAAALLAYGNMIAYNLVTSGGALADFQTHDYAWVSNPSLGVYWSNMNGMVSAFGGTLGGQVPRLAYPFGGAVAVLLVVWFLASLVYAARRGETLPALVFLSSALILPYVNKRYEGLLSQRYMAFLLPLCFAAMGMAAAGLWAWLRDRRTPAARSLAAVVVILALLLAAYPATAAFRYYAAETAAGRDNGLLIATTDYLRERLPADTALYLSANLQGEPGDGGFRYLRGLYYYLTLEGVDHWVLDLPDLMERLESDPATEAWLVLPAGDYELLAERLPVEPVAGAPAVINEGVIAHYTGDRE